GEAVPVEVEVEVEVEEADEEAPVPSLGSAVPLPLGAVGLTPPTLITVEMPPLERWVILVETIVVDVEDVAGPVGEAAADFDPSGISGAVGRTGRITRADMEGAIWLELALPPAPESGARWGAACRVDAVAAGRAA